MRLHDDQIAMRAQRGFAPQDPALNNALKALQRPRTWATLRALATDWVTIGIAAGGSLWLFREHGLSTSTILAYGLALIVIGSRQKGLENITHEGAHFSLSSNPKINDWIVRWLSGIWIAPGYNVKSQRKSHVANHHGHFGNPQLDVEFYGYMDLGLGTLPSPSRAQSLRILFMALLRKTWWRLNSDFGSFWGIRGVAAVGASAVLWYFGLLLPVLMYWFVPLFVVYLPMRFLAEASEHVGLGFSTEFGTTRNKLGWFQEYIMHPHGDGYHIVHHLYPRIPHQNLARAHRLLMTDSVYARANHCNGLLLAWKGPTTLGQMTTSGRPAVADLHARVPLPG
jgi:fatty acid desaturase